MSDTWDLDLDSDSDLDEDSVIQCSLESFSALCWCSPQLINTPLHTSVLSGQQWLDELLAEHHLWFYNELSMHKHVFCQLLTIFKADAGLHDTQYVLAEEQDAVFLHYVCRGLSNRALQEQFQHSGDTIRKWV